MAGVSEPLLCLLFWPALTYFCDCDIQLNDRYLTLSISQKLYRQPWATGHTRRLWDAVGVFAHKYDLDPYETRL